MPPMYIPVNEIAANNLSSNQTRPRQESNRGPWDCMQDDPAARMQGPEPMSVLESRRIPAQIPDTLAVGSVKVQLPP